MSIVIVIVVTNPASIIIRTTILSVRYILAQVFVDMISPGVAMSNYYCMPHALLIHISQCHGDNSTMSTYCTQCIHITFHEAYRIIN